MSAHGSRYALPARRFLAGVAAVLLASTCFGWTTAARAGAQQTIGLPVFTGPDDPVPPEPAPFTVDDTMRDMFEADLFGDPAQYPIFPFSTTNQADKAAAQAVGQGGSNKLQPDQLDGAVP